MSNILTIGKPIQHVLSCIFVRRRRLRRAGTRPKLVLSITSAMICWSLAVRGPENMCDLLIFVLGVLCVCGRCVRCVRAGVRVYAACM